jgi:hypothetical protein
MERVELELSFVIVTFQHVYEIRVFVLLMITIVCGRSDRIRLPLGHKVKARQT